MRHPRVLLAAFASISLALVVGACGGDDDDGGNGGNGGNGDSTVPDEDVRDDWVTVTDEATGVSFELPEEAQPETQQIPAPNGETLSATLYTVELDDDAGAVVAGFIEVPSGTANFDLHASIQGSATNIGGTVESETDTTFEGQPAVDADVAFTQGGVDARDLMRVVILDETYVLQLQALGRADDDNVAAMFDRLANSVELPAA